MRTTWTLRADAKWQDGQPVTAQDVVFGNQLYQDPELSVEPSGSSRSEPFISSVVARDARTFDVSWKQLKLEAGQPKEGDLVPLPRHLLEELYTSGNKQAFNGSSFWTTSEYVGAGPFRVVGREPGVDITLSAFAGFFLGKPKIDTIQIVLVTDRNALVARLIAGDIDFTEVIDPQQAVVFQETWKQDGGGRVYTTLNKSTSVIFQQRDVPNHQTALQDLRVRQALLHAIDRDEVAAVATARLAPAAVVGLPPSYPLFPRMEAAAGRYPFDLRRTEQLILDAGWVKGSDGVLRGPSGQPFDLEMYGADTIQLILIDYWKRAGINAYPAPEKTGAVSPQEVIMADANFAGAAIETKGPFLYGDYAASQLPTEQNRWTGKNRPSWTNLEYEATFPLFEHSLVQSERDDLAVDLERIITTDVGVARLHYNPEPAAARSNVHGVTGKSQGQIPTYIWNITQWTVD